MTSRNFCAHLLLAVIGWCWLWSPYVALAQGAASPEHELDLSSTSRSLQASSVLQSGSADLQVGAATTTVTPASLLTPAELLALQQVLSPGSSQSLTLGADGNAVGGTVTLNAGLNLSSLTVPPGVTVLTDFASSSLNLTGNLTNSGTLYAFSSDPQVGNASISALNILNQQGGILSSNVPTGFFSQPIAALLNLSLNAVNNIINVGTITSAGNLSLTAGNSIINSLPAGVIGAAPIMQAVNNLNLQSGLIINEGQLTALTGNINAITAQVQNAGIMQALAGSISVRNVLDSGLSINNLLGQIHAQQNILIETAASPLNTEKLDVIVNGGNLHATNLIFNSAGGLVDINVNRMNGLVQISGCDAKVAVQGGDLAITSLILTGDPVFTNATGDVNLGPGPGAPGSMSLDLFAGGNLFQVSGDFIVSAGRDIVALNGAAGTVNVSNTNGPGGRIILTAGTAGNGGSVLLPSVSFRTNSNEITITAAASGTNLGNVSVGLLDSSGAGGACCYNSFGVKAASGQNAGPITINAGGGIATGALRAFGGGGAGGVGGGASGGDGGDGGAVYLRALNGNIGINGEVNTSGGGGGGLSASQIGTTSGGRGGNAGFITAISPGTFLSVGPLLAAGGGGGAGNTVPPCCPQIFRNGGASFGGGGGGGDVGAGGGGFVGGGGSGSVGSGGGGGFFGGGAGDNGQPSGSLGRGGGAFEGVVNHIGGAFGVGGANTNVVEQKGFGNAGGNPGTTGLISLSATSSFVQNSIGAYFGSVSTGFAQSPFVNETTHGTLVILSPSVPVGPNSAPQPVTATTDLLGLTPLSNNTPRQPIVLPVPGSAPPQGVILPTDTLSLPNPTNPHMTLYGIIMGYTPTGTGTQYTAWSEIYGHGNNMPSGDAILNLLTALGPAGSSWVNPAYLPSGLSGDAMMNALSQSGAFQNAQIMHLMAMIAAQAAAANGRPHGLLTPTLGSTGTGFLSYAGPSGFIPFTNNQNGFAPFTNNSNGFTQFTNQSNGAPLVGYYPVIRNGTLVGYVPVTANGSGQGGGGMGGGGGIGGAGGNMLNSLGLPINTSATLGAQVDAATGNLPGTLNNLQNTFSTGTGGQSGGGGGSYSGSGGGGGRLGLGGGSFYTQLGMPTNTSNTLGGLIDAATGNLPGTLNNLQNTFSTGTGGALSPGPSSMFNMLGMPTNTSNSLGNQLNNTLGPSAPNWGSLPTFTSVLPLLQLPVFLAAPVQLETEGVRIFEKGKFPWHLIYATAMYNKTLPSKRNRFNFAADCDMSVSKALLDSPFAWTEVLNDVPALTSSGDSKNAMQNYAADLDTSPELALEDSTFDWRQALTGVRSDEAATAYGAATKVGSAERAEYELKNGNIFISADEPMTLKDGATTIAIARGVKALVLKSDRGLAIYNLHDTHRKALLVSKGELEVPVEIGQALILSDGVVDELQDAEFGSTIAVRHIEKIDLSTSTMFQFEFSIPSAMQSIAPLKHLRISKKEKDKIANREISKVAALLTVMGAGEPYKYVTPAAPTAFVPQSTRLASRSDAAIK